MTSKYIAMTGLSMTENLGSQMWHFASLYAISRRTGHRVLFFREFAEVGKGLRLHRHFKDLPFELISIDDLDEGERMHVVFPIPRDVLVDSRVYQIDPRLNYNFTGLFISYRYWYPLRAEVARMYRFDGETCALAKNLVQRAAVGGRQVVAVHVRRDDYINGVFVNVTREYYDAAFARFDPASVSWLIFSDDMPWCRQEFNGMADVHYSDGATPIVDMCAMSMCQHNIIANSSFGFWGAFLNRHPDKVLICPARTMKQDRVIPHLNYGWYPDEFVGLDIGNT